MPSFSSGRIWASPSANSSWVWTRLRCAAESPERFRLCPSWTRAREGVAICGYLGTFCPWVAKRDELFRRVQTYLNPVRALCLALTLLPGLAAAQFVYPKPEDNRPEPGVYVEDPFIIKYRKRFFAVFRGDFATFNKAYGEIEEMVKKDPKDARALVWLGNGQTVKAGSLKLTGKNEEAAALLEKSRETLDRAVALSPKDPNIYMMRAATLYVQGQYWPADKLPRAVWERLRDDCERFIAFIGPKRMPKVSTHVRGEAYGELGIAYLNLGEKEKAQKTFQKLIQVCPGTAYEQRAKKEIEKLRG
ncbi:tetratricopeptide repeat protein [bacterium]|nr:MAG: tetratricopeptide repeat protein [bacterium]